MNVDEKIALCAIKSDANSHIELNLDACADCKTRICIKACPAHLYEFDAESSQMKVEHAGCLECGTCLIICPSQAVSWKYPEASFGICYRYG